MLISQEEAKLFFALYHSVIGFAAGRSGGIEGIRDTGTFKSAPNEAKAQARNHLLNNIELIKDYMEDICVSVVDRTDWGRNDFKPHQGQRLLS